MKNSVILDQDEALGPDQILKVTALLYLKEALLGQEYETCAELVEIGKKFGASQGEINGIITSYLQGGTAEGQKEARKWKNRLRPLKENK